MTELELKAHVDDRAALAGRLDSFARRGQHVIRDDDYWGRSPDDRHKIRIRRESFLAPDGSTERTDILVTYKRKSRIKGADGVEAEANDEKECTVSDAAVLETFLTDAGYAVQLKKHKDVEDWLVELPAGVGVPSDGGAGISPARADSAAAPAADGGTGRLQATLELCAVQGLGDFLEIEILSPSDDVDVLATLHGELERLLERSGISKDRIEDRYYSELLKDMAIRT